ncbi:SgcJ/EcaC family oxidoreductase [Nostoc sp. KVJ20]|uniref:SgcJ/EcaC family oxidoreductase n=1 Tax=Nostoc sp. KVJ20 TaxID=457944 RepID=UPI00210AFF56|nr:SgcJ/EcaC family oxidoreductase [Nostoc sp. KVJ20]
MNSQTAQTTTNADESAIRAFLYQMIDAWNRGSGEGFAAPFSKTADFLTFEGTHLKGRKEIAAFTSASVRHSYQRNMPGGGGEFCPLRELATRAHARSYQGNTARTN